MSFELHSLLHGRSDCLALNIAHMLASYLYCMLQKIAVLCQVHLWDILSENNSCRCFCNSVCNLLPSGPKLKLHLLQKQEQQLQKPLLRS